MSRLGPDYRAAYQYATLLKAVDDYRSAHNLPGLIHGIERCLSLLKSEPADLLYGLEQDWGELEMIYALTVEEHWPNLTPQEEADVRATLDRLRALVTERIGSHRYPCPCCGHVVFDHEPGTFAVCPVCGWVDDQAALLYPLWDGGDNGVSLADAQAAYARTGACTPSAQAVARPAVDEEPLEAGWRPLDPATDNPLPKDAPASALSPVAGTDLYYWRDTYWRRR